MKKNFLYVLFLLPLFASCQTLYTYRLPNETEQKRFADSLHWGYAGNMITNIPVFDENNVLYRLPVTSKTKIEIRTIYGEQYRFYVQSIKVSGDDSILGNKMWTGYELLNHAQVSINVHDIQERKILSDEKAVTPIGMP